MSSTEKTSNLQLNAWIGTDKPTRVDFVTDNNIIDKAISSHIADNTKHLTEADRLQLSTPYKTGYYSGDGTATKVIPLEFSPKIVFVFRKNVPAVTKDSSGNMLCNTAFAVASNGGSGISISGNSFSVYQSTSAIDGGINNLNASGGQYTYIAIR